MRIIYCSKSKSSTIIFYSEHSQTLPVTLSATFTIEEHDCPLQEAYGVVSHIQDVDEGNHYEVSLILVPEPLPSYAHTLSFSYR